jgi:hypothetical protein
MRIQAGWNFRKGQPDIELRETWQGPARHAVGLKKVNLPVVSGGLGKNSNSRAWILATANGTGMSSRRLPMTRDVKLTSSRSVYTQGPAARRSGRRFRGRQVCGPRPPPRLPHRLAADAFDLRRSAAAPAQPREAGERVEQRIARTEHGTRADNSGILKRLPDYQFAAPPGPNVR